MKRLNGIMALLTDAGERARYDLELHLKPPPGPPKSGKPWPRWWPWPLASILMIGAAALLSHPTERRPNIITSVETPPGPTTAAPKPNRAPTAHTAKRPRLKPAPTDVPVEGITRPPDKAVPPADEPALSPLEIAVPALLLQPLRSPPPSSYAGEWLYVPSKRVESHGVYPPEYIEMHLDERHGTLHGRYRARYCITDQAVSPTVIFQFQGPASPDASVLPWIGPGGATGEVTLRLLDRNAIEVTWVATRLGNELALAKGAATLVRRLE